MNFILRVLELNLNKNMNTKELKYLLRSKSFNFAKNLNDHSNRLTYINWENTKIYYRTCSSDMVLIYEILLKSELNREYYFPKEIKPKIIFDIGGNIGITAIYLANIFPESIIYSFEPLQENFEILKKNAANYKNIKVFNFGLGSKSGSFKVFLSDDKNNFGGVSFKDSVEGNLDYSNTECIVKNINDFISEEGISSVDLIKIDTEGAEFEILTTFNKEYLDKTSWITGELHGNRDFELLNFLDISGFSISVHKNINNRLFMFNAGRKEIISKLGRKEIRIL